jgi:hypothetical protein
MGNVVSESNVNIIQFNSLFIYMTTQQPKGNYKASTDKETEQTNIQHKI